MLKALFETQKGYIDYFFNHLDYERAEALLELMVRSKGCLFFTGVGKSGMIAEKLAMTMVSIGVRAWYIPPTNALHGDLGIVSPGDLFICLSKSGESDELLNLLPFLRNKGAHIVSWVSSKGSRLEKGSDLVVYLPLERELCPFDLSPTTSDVVQLLFGNVLTVALMQARNFQLTEYAKNHPAGRIGRRITMKTRDLMLKGEALPIAKLGDKLQDRLHELSDKRCGCLCVVDEEMRMRGIFTDGDLRRALQAKGGGVLSERLEELMSKGFQSIAADTLAYDALRAMEADPKRPFTVLPVLEEEQLVGLIKMHDIVQSGL
ncbi:MAG: SIS domain-containing protein [Parachlamydiales bacterium]